MSSAKYKSLIVKHGTPQGSAVSPAPFPQMVKICLFIHTLIFEDGTAVYTGRGSSPEEAQASGFDSLGL